LEMTHQKQKTLLVSSSFIHQYIILGYNVVANTLIKALFNINVYQHIFPNIFFLFCGNKKNWNCFNVNFLGKFHQTFKTTKLGGGGGGGLYAKKLKNLKF
jgi:hypothetical protein